MGRSKKKYLCKNCEVEFKKHFASGGKYCSRYCQGVFQFRVKLEAFLNKEIEAKTNKPLRKFLSALHGERCSVCGLSKWNEKDITLEVEHIDGNSLNNSIENVCLICPNCHSQTPTYKGRNRGKGRFKRAERYRKGLSY